MPRIDIKGVLIPNDYKWFYDFMDMDSTCPRDVQKVLDVVGDGDDLDVCINSPGGVIDVGSEIYTALHQIRERANLRIHIVGEACSAASVVAMAGYCEMAPTALMMVHCVSTGVSGNHSIMEHTAEVLRTADRAICSAYMEKAGMTEDEALDMMEHETWLTARQAKERGLIDEIMFLEEEKTALAAGPLFKLPTMEQLERAKRMTGENKQSVSEPCNSDRGCEQPVSEPDSSAGEPAGNGAEALAGAKTAPCLQEKLLKRMALMKQPLKNNK